MSCLTPRQGAPRFLPTFLLTLLFHAIPVLSLVAPASAFTANTLGDFDNVTVMEVSGSYDAIDGYGLPDMSARRQIAREFYRNHGDDYDFLVIFTNFDFRMPSLRAKAFFSPAKNDVQGIGLELSDHTYAYTPDGSFLARLQGTIDMANIAGHVLEPADPDFDETLMTLTHEMMHRWGAYVHFHDGSGESDALLGLDGAHWSFLLDAGGSTLYGSNWQDNGDGTFTSVAPEQVRSGEVIGRIFSPLDLYLMGLADRSQVPPLRLIDSPGLDRSKLPEIGVTIPGTVRTVTIDDIIAVEGERVPAASSRKEFRMAFIYAVAPGSWNWNDARDLGDLSAVNRLQQEWEKRFSILTDGAGMMHTSLVASASLDTNPEVTIPIVAPTVVPSVTDGISWLARQQNADGSWRDLAGTEQRDTAMAVSALKLFPEGAAGAARGQNWLSTVTPDNSDFLARKLLGFDRADPAGIAVLQNVDGGWGCAPGFRSNPVDTALALQALTNHGSLDHAVLTAAVNSLHAAQNPDGGWGDGSGDSSVQSTAMVLLALNPHRRSYPIEPAIVDGLAWLLARQNADGGFDSSPGAVLDTAVTLQALKATGASQSAVDNAVAYLLARQSDGGSWNKSIFQTAKVVGALYAGQVAADLVVEAADIVITPSIVSTVPSDIAVAATVRNLGSVSVVQAKVSLYENDPVLGHLLGESVIDVPGKGSAQVSFIATVSEAGQHSYYLVIDEDNQVAEANEWNNSIFKTVAASIPPPRAGFNLVSSAGPEARADVALTVSLGYPWPEPVTVNYSVNTASTAVPSADYMLANGTLNFAAGETDKTINLKVVNDLVPEVDKTVIVDLTGTSLGIPGLSRHVYTIRDDEAPAVIITSPPSGLSGQSAPMLLYTTTGSNVVVKVDGTTVSKVSGNTLAPLTDGQHSVEVTARNSYGLATTSKVDFIIDTALPTVTIRSPLSEAVTNARPLLDYLVTSAARLEVLMDGAVVSQVAGNLLGPLTDGRHILTVNAWNATGAKSSAQVVFQVDARPPVVDIISPGNEYIREINPVLHGRIDEAVETVVWLDGIETAYSSGDSIGPLSSGVHRLRMVATDAVGNIGSDEVVFAVSIQGEEAFVPASGWPEIVEGAYGGIAADRSGNVCVVTKKVEKEFDIIKYNAAGDEIWHASKSSFFNILGGNWVDVQPKDVAIDSLGNIYIAGWGFYISRNYGILAKYDANGNYLKHILFDTGKLYGNTQVYSVNVDDNDQIYISGNTDYDLFSVEKSTPATMFVGKYDSDLTLLHGKSYGYAYDPASFYFFSRDSMVVDDKQNVFITGVNGSHHLLVWKLAPDLSRSNVEIVGAENTFGMDIDVDQFGFIYVVGSGPSGGAVWKYSADGQLNATATEEFPYALTSLAANNDGTVFLLDSAGIVRKLDERFVNLWSIGLGGDFDSKIVPDLNGSLLIGGSDDTANVASVTKISDPRHPEFYFDKGVFYANSPTAVLTGYLAQGYAVVLENSEYDLSGYSHEVDSGRWQMVVGGLPEGESRIVVSVTNASGFIKRYEAGVVVDTVAPRVEITSPADNSTWFSKPILSYHVDEGEVRVFVNGIDVTKLSGFPIDSLRAGENRIRVQSIDSSGNAGFDDITIQAAGAAVGEHPLDIGDFWKIGAAGDQTVVDVEQDAEGNLYLFGDTTQGFPGYSSSSRDLYVAKYDLSGRLLKLWQLGGPAHDYGAALAVTASGDFLISYNVASFNASTNAFDNSIVIAKYDASGTLLWKDEMDSGADDQVYGLMVDATGNAYACGSTQGRLSNRRYGGNTDYFLLKYNAIGGRVWTVLSNASTNDVIKDIKLSGDGFIYATGRMNDTGAMSLFKFDLNGVRLWKVDYKYGSHQMFGEKLEIGLDGNLYTLVGTNYVNCYVVTKHGPHGNFIKEAIGQAPSIKGLGLALDAGSDVYVTGYTDASNSPEWSLAGVPNFGDEDIFIAKHASADLRTIWNRQFGDARGQQGCSLLSSRISGQIYLAGVTDGNFAGTESGGQEVFLASLVQPAELSEPVLIVADCQSPTKYLFQSINGYATPGTHLSVAVTAPAGSSAKISPPVQSPDGTWWVTVNNLVANADNILTVSATGANSTTSRTVVITADTNPPLLSIDPVVSPTIQAAQTITGRIENASTLTMAGGLGEIAVTNGSWSQDVELLQEGDNVFTFTATDGAGNQTVQSVAISFALPPLPTLVVTPAVISSDESADITLKIGNISPPGATAVVIQTFDLDGNGLAGPGEPVVRRFSVADGVACENLNIVSDVDGHIDGQVVMQLNYRFVNDRYHAAGQYVFAVETAGGRVSQTFGVIGAEQSQRLEGHVRSGQGVPIGGALVELHDRWGRSHGFVTSDSSGRYCFNIGQPGDYLPVPMADGYVFDRETISPVTVAPGQVATQDLIVFSGIRQVNGQVRDAVTAAGLPGVSVRMENRRYLAVTMSAGDGQYALHLPDGDYTLAVEIRPGDGLASQGYAGTLVPLQSVSVGTDLFGQDVLVSRGDGLVCGKVRSGVGAGIGGAPVLAVAADDSGWHAEAYSNAQGGYCVALTAGKPWRLWLHGLTAYGIGMVGTSGVPSLPDLTVYPIDARIAGSVRDAAGQPVAGVVVEASHVTGTVASVETAMDGRYLLGISTEPAGDWLVTVYGENDGFAPVLPVALGATYGQTVTHDFTLVPLRSNTIVITRATYDTRKKVLNVEATSDSGEAALEVVGFGPMKFSRLSKGKYYWYLSRSIEPKPETVTVSGPEGSRTAAVQ